MRILKRAGVVRVDTHGIRRHCQFGIPIKVDMALTAHKTIAMFMRYVHTEDNDGPRSGAELVIGRRKVITGTQHIETTEAAT